MAELVATVLGLTILGAMAVIVVTIAAAMVREIWRS